MKAVLVNFDLNLSSQHWILMLFVKGMRLVTCFAIYLTVTNMSKMALIKSATLNTTEIPKTSFAIYLTVTNMSKMALIRSATLSTIEIPKTSFTIWCKIGK